MPPGIDYYVWRVLVSPKLHGVTWRDLHTSMSHQDLVDANDLLDALENAEILARKGAT